MVLPEILYKVISYGRIKTKQLFFKLLFILAFPNVFAYLWHFHSKGMEALSNCRVPTQIIHFGSGHTSQQNELQCEKCIPLQYLYFISH